MVTMRVGRVACVMVLAASAAWAQSRPCSSHESFSDCVGQRCENDVQYCVWNVAAGSCGCPRSCSEYYGDVEPCINSVCPSLLPQQHVPCNYNYITKKCWCPEAAETGAPATPAPPTSAPPTSAPPTSAPPTPAPATPAPATPAPAPATYAPGTTLVPATEAPEPPLCNETTLVLNPSFEIITTTTNIAEALENGHMQSWEVSHGHPTVMPGAPGQGLRSAWMWSHTGAGEGIVTNVPFVDGQTYHVSMWVTTGNSVSGHFFVKAVVGLVTQTTIWPLPSSTNSDVMYSNGMVFPDWDEISFSYTATDAFTQLWIHPLWAGGAPQAQVRVDNIRVCAVETDAPATPAPPTAPPTSAPPTPAPATPAPATPAPPTSAPPTSAPPTSAPPTPAPATPAPATPAPPTRPPVERCEDLNFQQETCINTLCPGFAGQFGRRMYCKYNEKSGVCWCPEEVETKAPATPWPVVSDDCSSFHGLPRTCMSSLCVISGMRASCKYDYSSNLCLCA